METMTVPGAEKQIDELSKRVDFGFEQTNQRLGRVEDDLRELRAEMNVGFHHGDDQFSLNRTETKVGFDQVRVEFGKVGDEFGRVGDEFGRVGDEFGRVNDEFGKVSDEFTAVRAEMAEGFQHTADEFTAVRAEMAEGFQHTADEFTAVRAEMKAGFDGMQRMMTRFFAGTLGTIVAGVIISAILSHF
jgi:hypothetical protein